MIFIRKTLVMAAIALTLFTAMLYVSCKKEDDPCKGIACINGGACNGGKCVCPTSYTGTYCETPTDPCLGVTCQNGGSCTGGSCNCPTGTTGTMCETIYRDGYTNTYAGNGTDNLGNTYTNFRFTFNKTGTDFTKMLLTMETNTGLMVLENLPITLTGFTNSGSSFTINSYTTSGLTYTGSGNVSGVLASVILNETDASGTSTYTFTNLSKQ